MAWFWTYVYTYFNSYVLNKYIINILYISILLLFSYFLFYFYTTSILICIKCLKQHKSKQQYKCNNTHTSISIPSTANRCLGYFRCCHSISFRHEQENVALSCTVVRRVFSIYVFWNFRLGLVFLKLSQLQIVCSMLEMCVRICAAAAVLWHDIEGL